MITLLHREYGLSFQCEMAISPCFTQHRRRVVSASWFQDGPRSFWSASVVSSLHWFKWGNNGLSLHRRLETMSWLQFGHVGTDLVIQSTGQIIGNHLSQYSMKGKFGNSTWWVMTVSKVANKLKVVFLDSYALVWHHIRSSIIDGVTARRSHQFQSLKTGALTESLHCISLLCSDLWAIITSSVDPTIDEIQYDVIWG